MRTLIALLATCLTVAAQDAEFLYCKTVEEALAVIAQIDETLGYPNPATKTVTSVAPIVNKDGTCIIRLSIGAVWSPRTKSSIAIAPITQTKVTPAQWGEKVLTTTDVLYSKATIARIDDKKATAMGFFDTAVVPEPKEDPPK